MITKEKFYNLLKSLYELDKKTQDGFYCHNIYLNDSIKEPKGIYLREITMNYLHPGTFQFHFTKIHKKPPKFNTRRAYYWSPLKDSNGKKIFAEYLVYHINLYNPIKESQDNLYKFLVKSKQLEKVNDIIADKLFNFL